MEGQTDKKKTVSAIFNTIPAILMLANFIGLASNRSFAKASADNASRAIINAVQVMYCGCFSTPRTCARGYLNNKRTVVKIVVENNKEMIEVLNTSDADVLFFENRK